jgi:hypothetical protein
MEQLVTGVIIGAAAATFIVLALVIARAGGVAQMKLGMTAAGKAAQDKGFAEKLTALIAGAEPKPAVPPPPPKPSGAALRMLALLQEEARLVDFLLEDISGASDAQIGQAVREVHRKAQAALRQHAVIETVLSGNEGDTTTVPRGFDPSAVRVVGNVTGEPPFTGQIQHPGWRVRELKLAPPPQGADEFVLQPAEVQIP